jgi:hypothetical protein
LRPGDVSDSLGARPGHIIKSKLVLIENIAMCGAAHEIASVVVSQPVLSPLTRDITVR